MEFYQTYLPAYNDEEYWLRKRIEKAAEEIKALANQYRQHDGCMFRWIHCGASYYSIRLAWDDEEEDWLIRFPNPEQTMISLDEKILNEVDFVLYIWTVADIPMPCFIGCGLTEGDRTGLGPYILTTWVEGVPMSEILRKKEEGEDVLGPNVDGRMMEILYGQMADILLELWDLDFDRIGSIRLDKDKKDKMLIGAPPLTQETNELIKTGHVYGHPPTKIYDSSVDYIFSLLEMQKIRLMYQSIDSYNEQDCREKYTCRHLMRAIALNYIRDNNGPFKLFCESLHPDNVLVDTTTLEITAVTRWDFAYAAPAQFSASVPSWLTLQRPEAHMDDGNFLSRYLDAAGFFLRVLQQREEARGMVAADRLSARMQRSLQDRCVWFNLACVRYMSVDAVYWNMLDEYCWGPRSSRAERVHQITTGMEMHRDREELVRFRTRCLQYYYTS